MSHAEKALAEAIRDGMANDTFFYTVIGALLEHHDLGRAHAAIESIEPAPLMRAMGAKSFHTEACKGLLTKLVILKDYWGAWKLFERLDACGLTPDGSLCAVMMKTVMRADFEGRASALLDRCWGDLTETVVCDVTRAWMRCGNARGLKHLMDSQRGYPHRAHASIEGILLRSVKRAMEASKFPMKPCTELTSSLIQESVMTCTTSCARSSRSARPGCRSCVGSSTLTWPGRGLCVWLCRPGIQALQCTRWRS